MRQFFENCKTFCRQVWHGLRQIKTLRLSHLGKVFSLMGRREKILLLAFAGLATVGLMSTMNFVLHSDFRWVLVVPAVSWAAGVMTYVASRRA